MKEIGVEVRGVIGYLILRQPATLNALTGEMIAALREGLASHEADPSVAIIVIRSDDQRAFCAGGEMKRLRQFALSKDSAAIADYFSAEYALNLAIANCCKPYLALIDGIAMGGGLGLSVHGQYRVVTENAVLAMPETRIGFFPDVGGSYFLPRLPHRCGYWLGLTAASVKGHQAVSTGLGTHYIRRNDLPALMNELEHLTMSSTKRQNTTSTYTGKTSDNASTDDTLGEAVEDFMAQRVREHLDRAASTPVDNEFDQCLQQRSDWFSDTDAARTEQRLETAAADNPDAQKLLALFKAGSPYSRSITLSLFERTAGLNLQTCLEHELALATDAYKHPDFAEGIRAVLVDKDKQPRWQT